MKARPTAQEVDQMLNDALLFTSGARLCSTEGILFALLIIFVCLLNPFSVYAQNPVPSVSNLVPNSVSAGSPAFTLTVNGTNFVSGSVVQWNGSARTTTFVNATQLHAAISAADVNAAGTAQVAVFNPAPGGGTSNALTFTITNANPTVSGLSPNSVVSGGVGFVLTVNGSNFVSGSVVQWNGSGRSTTFVSPTQLQAAISSADIIAPGTVQITVVNPAPSGGTSNPVNFTIFSPTDRSITRFNISSRAVMSMTTPGTSPSITVGYASVQPDSGSSTPFGVVIFELRQGGVLISETSVATSAAVQSGRIYAEVGAATNTGLAIANPSSQDAVINYYYTDNNGQDFGSGVTTVRAGQQIASFLNQPPFNGGSSIQGTFTFNASAPVAVVGVLGVTNERGDFLMSTLPVTLLSSAATDPVVLSQFADGLGWTTTLLLVNPTDNDIAGTVQFLDPSGQAQTLSIGASTSNVFSYTVRRRSSQKLVTLGNGPLRVGSIHVIPASGQTAPAAIGVYTYRSAGITVSQTGVSPVRGSTLDVYAENAGGAQSGIAIANISSSATTATLQLTRSDGTTIGSASLQIPGQGQIAKFIGELFPTVPTPFQGILRITSGSSDLSVVGLRLRTNERGETLITATPAANEDAPRSSDSVYFPHLADGGGYSSQFLLLGTGANPADGTMRLWKADGTALNLIGNAAQNTAP